MSRDRGARLTLLAAAGLASLLLGEGVLRLSGVRPDAWRAVPSLEDRLARAGPREPGRLRIVALGDSFTEYADDRRGNWVRVLQDRARRDGIDLDVVNLGQQGTGVKHYTANLVQHSGRLRPDLVLVGLYLGNDVLDFEIDAAKARRGLPPTPVQALERRTTGPLAALRSRSALLTALAQLAKDARVWAGSSATTFDRSLAEATRIFGLTPDEHAAALARADPELVRLARADRINGWDLAFAIVRPRRYRDLVLLRGESAPAMRDFETALLAMDDACRLRVPRGCVYVTIPSAPQVGTRYFAYLQRCGFELSADMVGDSPLLLALRSFFRTHGMPFADASEALASEAAGVFLAMDTHLNELGQEVLGASVYESLRSGGMLVPPDEARPEGEHDVEALDTRVLPRGF